MDIMSVFTAVGSAASGGLLGLFGTGFKMWAEQKAVVAQHKFQLAMRQADRDEMQLESELEVKRTQAQADRDIALSTQSRLTAESQAQAEIEMAELDVYKSSYQHDKAQYGGGLIDGIRGLMRPFITSYLIIIMSVIAYRLTKATELNVAAKQVLLGDVINAILFLTTTAVVWWFGSRPSKQMAQVK